MTKAKSCAPGLHHLKWSYPKCINNTNHASVTSTHTVLTRTVGVSTAQACPIIPHSGFALCFRIACRQCSRRRAILLREEWKDANVQKVWTNISESDGY